MRKLLIFLGLFTAAFLTSSAFAETTTTAIGRPVFIMVTGAVGGAPSTKAYPPISPLPCIPRPACLDARPRCMIAEPANGWCNTTPTISVTPTPIHCGGFIRSAQTCPTGFVCKLGKTPDTGGTCEPINNTPTITPTITWVSVREDWHLGNPVQNFFSNIFNQMIRIFHL